MLSPPPRRLSAFPLPFVVRSSCPPPPKIEATAFEKKKVCRSGGGSNVRVRRPKRRERRERCTWPTGVSFSSSPREEQQRPQFPSPLERKYSVLEVERWTRKRQE